VGPAARGLSLSLDEALPDVTVTYVHIGTAVAPAGEAGPASVGADAVAERYLDVVEAETATRELELRRR
jgi:hypothetical protein